VRSYPSDNYFYFAPLAYIFSHSLRYQIQRCKVIIGLSLNFIIGWRVIIQSMEGVISQTRNVSSVTSTHLRELLVIIHLFWS